MNSTWLGHAIRKGVFLTALPFVLLSGLIATGGEDMLTQERVRELFDYREDGRLVWRISRGNKKAGDIAGGSLDTHGYIQTGADGVVFLNAHLVFIWHHGYKPECVDHINRVRTDDRIENLRPATKRQNCQNSNTYRNNSSGVTGVVFNKRLNKWNARITANGERISLGWFTNKEEARKARNQAEGEFFGEYAPA
jgi:hypothetical protein